MKKFVSIVIALVMVLSMTSAFAWSLDCSVRDFAWDCETEISYCGKGTLEVVPYVKANTACDGWEYVESDCASAIKSEKVFYAVKLTVDAYPNADWWNKASAKIEGKGLDAVVALPGGTGLKGVRDLIVNGTYADKYDEDEAQVFYLLNDGDGWINAEDDAFKLKDVVASAKVTEAAKAKVCVTLKSEHSGVGPFTWGDYAVEVAKDVTVEGVAFDYIITIEDKDDDRNWVQVRVFDGEVADVLTSGTSKAFYNDVVADFNLAACAIGTCVNKDSIQANFGWKDKAENCFAWSTEGATTVNPECAVSVEIPKTGDVSVVAYAVMAIVAAAGTMLKK